MADVYIISGVNDPWNHYRNVIGAPSRRLIICGGMAIIFVLFLAVISFAVMSRQDNSKRRSSASFEAYELFESALNESVDPCTNFYDFACGLWGEDKNVTEYGSRVTTFSLLQSDLNDKKREIFLNTKLKSDLPLVVNSAIHFYNVCIQQDSMDDSNIQLLLDYFNEMGGWPILNRYDWRDDAFDWFESSAFLIKTLDVHSVIGVYTYDNDKDSRNVIYLKPPMLFPNDDMTLEYYSSQQMLYFIVKSLNSSFLSSYEDLMQDILDLSELEAQWREILSAVRQTPDRLFLSIGELNQKVPEVDWLRYLQLITNETLLEINDTLTLEDVVAIQDLDYLKKVVILLNSDTFSKRKLANLFGWLAVKDVWILIPNVLKNYATMSAYEPDATIQVASNQCYDLVSGIFSSSFDYLYVKNSSHLGMQQSRILTKYLKSAFQNIIKKSEWLDDETKDLALLKLQNMKNIIGFPDYLSNKTEFDKIFEDFPIIKKVNLKYYFKILNYYSRLRFLSVKVFTSKINPILPRPVSDVSAYYLLFKNTLVYPLSLHNAPFFYFGGPWYLNFGAVGSVIGHEMMHGFDNIKHQENDVKNIWFSNSSKSFFLERAECFKNQYYVYDDSGTCQNNGSRTLRENIADSEGLRIAFEAYSKHIKDCGPEKKSDTLDGYSPLQMFFIAYGSIWCSKIEPTVQKGMVSGSHSLPKFRVNKAVSNLESFAMAFNCSKCSPMNPEKRCLMW